MHDGVDQMRWPRVILGTTPPERSAIRRIEFGGAILMLCILLISSVAANPTTLRVAAENAVRVKPLATSEIIQRICRLVIEDKIA
jgi:hypothetical protein